MAQLPARHRSTRLRKAAGHMGRTRWRDRVRARSRTQTGGRRWSSAREGGRGYAGAAAK